MNPKKIIVIILAVIITACTNSDKPDQSKTDQIISNKSDKSTSLTEEIQSRIGNDLIFDFSSDRTYSIVSQKIKKPVQFTGFKFLIVNEKEKSVIFEDFVHNGSVSWENDSVITVNIIPGMIKKDEESVSGYNLNVKTLVKTKKVNK